MIPRFLSGDLVDFEGRQYRVTALHEDRASIAMGGEENPQGGRVIGNFIVI